MSKRIPSQNSILAQIAEEDIPPGKIDLWPNLRKVLVTNKITERPGVSSTHPHVTKTRRWQLLAASVFLLALAILLITPPGQALAQQMLSFFTPAKATSYPAPTAVLTVSALDGQLENTPAPTATPSYAAFCPQTDPRQRYACALAFTQQKIGFPLKALSADSPLELTGVDIDPADSAVSLYYGSNATLILTQRRSPFPQSIRRAKDNNGEVPAEAVQSVTINGQPGEYVEGGFIMKPGSQQFTWDSSMSMARLRWKDGDTWFEMTKPGTPEALKDLLEEKESFIRLAESLVEAKAVLP